ncbi:MAG: hypothetical protein PHO15_05850 [Eubacteriales bacterium]|nr:hypothetical protein [Eubacteriales bacterium]
MDEDDDERIKNAIEIFEKLNMEDKYKVMTLISKLSSHPQQLPFEMETTL